jgi:para-aminobenzoate synthetase component 1
VLSASPERFLALDGDRVIGEPMKGTRPRSADATTDARLKQELLHDPKERSENIMALDVMRHDLSRIAATASVRVEELCAVRSYPRVHQLVSTVSATMAPGITLYDVVRAAFPMASMTGAPKERAMELIRIAEGAPRGAFSGTLGFMDPDGMADLNVVIRALVFDRRSGSVSLRTGSALTAHCDPSAEWEECQVKARSVIDALHHA